MSAYWLTPIVSREPLTLGAERLRLAPEASVAAFRAGLHEFHPRALMLFKAAILPADESYEACGTDALPFQLEADGDIVFDGSRLVLSHCGEALLDRLLGAGETRQALAAALSGGEFLKAAPEAPLWCERMSDWLDRGCEVVLLKEE